MNNNGRKDDRGLNKAFIRSGPYKAKLTGGFEQRRITSKHFEAKRIPFTSGSMSAPGGGQLVSGIR